MISAEVEFIRCTSHVGSIGEKVRLTIECFVPRDADAVTFGGLIEEVGKSGRLVLTLPDGPATAVMSPLPRGDTTEDYPGQW